MREVETNIELGASDSGIELNMYIISKEQVK